MRNNNFSVREEDEFISVRLMRDVQDEGALQAWLTLQFSSLITTQIFYILRMYRYWKRKFLLAPSWEWKGFVSDRFLLFCETNISDLFLKLCNNFLGCSLLFPVYFIVSWEHAWLYVHEDMTYGPEATQSRSRNSNLGPL